MLTPFPIGVFSTVIADPPSFTGYNADYLIGVTDLPWTPALPQNVGGDPAIWSISPSLPTGLTIDTNTGEISGTPTATVNSSFTVTATNTGGSAQQNVTITVTADTFIEWDTPGIFNWKFPNGVVNAYNRLQLASGGGGGAHTHEIENRYSGGGGGSGRHFTNLDYRPTGNLFNSVVPGTNVTISIGAGGDGSFVMGDPGVDGQSSSFEIDGFTPFLVAGGGGAPDPSANNDSAGGIAGGGNNGMPGYPGLVNSDPQIGQGDDGGSGAYGINGTYGGDPYGAPSGTILYQSGPYWYYSYLTIANSGLHGSGGGGGGWAALSSYLIGFGAGTPTNFGDGAPGADGYCKLDWNPTLNPTEFWETF